MIDGWLVLSNSFWIAGLSLLLATISWASWAASLEDIRFWTFLARPGVRRVWSLALVLFCAGMAATGRAWWEHVLWSVLAVAFLVYAIAPQQFIASSNKESDT
jgi:hypothetical protein